MVVYLFLDGFVLVLYALVTDLGPTFICFRPMYGEGIGNPTQKQKRRTTGNEFMTAQGLVVYDGFF
jgi:hypothetical protein